MTLTHCAKLCEGWYATSRDWKSFRTASWLAAQTLSWERCVASYEGVLLDAVRSRYARLHGLAILPEVDQQERRQLIGHQYGIPEMQVNAGEGCR